MATRRSRSQPTMGSKVVVRKMLRDIVDSRIEQKVATVSQAFGTVSTAGVVDAFTQSITQGSDINNRDGDMITLHTLDLVLTTAGTGTAVIAPAQVRYILFADNLNVGSVPGVTDVLQAASVTSGYNSVNRQKNRFKIYLDTVVDIVGGTAKASVSIDKRFKIGRKVFYSGSTGVAGSNGRGAIFLLHIASNTGATSYQYNWGWEAVYGDA